MNTRALTAFVLKGVLSPMLESVNVVSAPAIASARGIAVSEVKHERESDYQSVLRVSVDTERFHHSTAGTMFGERSARVIEIDGIRTEAELAPHMLYTQNHDKPGYVGRLGATLGEAGVNIATFHLGRNVKGGEAMALLEVDAPITDELLAKVARLQGVAQAKALTFA
jgi:D-3-phosphoglycerate dehydrogenase